MSLLMSASSYGEGQCSTCMGAHHEFQLKFLLVGDSDVGKNEILDMLPSENQPKDSPLPYIAAPKTTTILLEGKRVRLHLWDTSGQGRFSTIIRSYSRGAEGLLIVYDITNRWSFEGIKRWLVEIDEHAPGIPRILIGNRLHLEFKRAIPRKEVESFAAKRNMEYFEVSTLAFFNERNAPLVAMQQSTVTTGTQLSKCREATGNRTCDRQTPTSRFFEA
ncbi:hypothetical protein QR680_001777 [Steinernema hermaphroditum]|uniref:SOCS box domain-containing protein n=1 Tax=Steinernema hermaphroditum TaxID=289476 RepID=A0AA39LGV3_9BILA|nr:hypothetical protein QR680_001777 [Steinernema hermaphroditum]